MSRLNGSHFKPEQLLALANDHGLSMARVAELVVSVGALTGSSSASVSQAEAIRQAAVQRDNEVRALQAQGFLPVGVTRLPPSRPAQFNLASVPNARLIEAVQVLETNSHPVSNPSHANAADPLFATWFKALDALGTRTLTMAEMNGVIRSDLAWGHGANEFRRANTFAPVLDPSTGLEAFHELHKFVVGFRGHPSLQGRPWLSFAGQGGETGAFARMTDPGQYNSLGEKVGVKDANAVREFFEQDLKMRADFKLDRGNWAYMENKLIESPSSYVAMVLDSQFGVGYYADPHEQAELKGTLATLRASEPNSPERIASVRALYKNLQSRDARLESVSVSGMTAELQMAQVLHEYLKLDRPEQRIDVTDPQQQIDAVQVYRLYQRMIASGELIQRGTVQTWLTDWNVRHAP